MLREKQVDQRIGLAATSVFHVHRNGRSAMQICVRCTAETRIRSRILTRRGAFGSNHLSSIGCASIRKFVLAIACPLACMRPRPLFEAASRVRLRRPTEIDNYNGQMKLWRSELSDTEWTKLYILIPGASLPRKNSLAVGYFAKLFEQEGEGNRVIYAKSQFDESQDPQLLATHLLDSRIGEVFFDDSSRMNRDLLGRAICQRSP